MKTTISLLAIITACASTAAFADDAALPIRPYVGMEYNYISASVKNVTADLDANLTNDFSGKLNADRYHAIVPNIGARIGNHFGLEVGYLHSTEESESLTGNL